MDPSSSSKPELVICYFIGRLNPPHEGHIKSLEQTISLVGDTPALILLGSGGKKKGYFREPNLIQIKEGVY